MPKQYRVVSQAAPVKGKIAQEVIQGLARLGMKAEQAKRRYHLQLLEPNRHYPNDFQIKKPLFLFRVDIPEIFS